MHLPFLKMHGTGNRILIIDQRGVDEGVPDTESLRRLGNPDTGPGFDQLMWLERADDEDVLATYRVFNNDGSEAEQCGNGLRCVAWMLSREGASEFTLGSPAGRVRARVEDDGRIAVSMGKPQFEPRAVPFEADKRRDRYSIDVAGRLVEVQVLSMGNPHCVITVEDVDSAPVHSLGTQLEKHIRFPEKTNVGFMAIRDPQHIDLRVFERGVGETLACGTGACAAVVAGTQSGALEGDVTVRMPGGELVVSWQPETVWLTGDVELLNEGTIDL